MFIVAAIVICVGTKILTVSVFVQVLLSVTVTVYNTLPVVTAVKVGLLMFVKFKFVAGLQLYVNGDVPPAVGVPPINVEVPGHTVVEFPASTDGSGLTKMFWNAESVQPFGLVNE